MLKKTLNTALFILIGVSVICANAIAAPTEDYPGNPHFKINLQNDSNFILQNKPDEPPLIVATWADPNGNFIAAPPANIFSNSIQNFGLRWKKDVQIKFFLAQTSYVYQPGNDPNIYAGCRFVFACRSTGLVPTPAGLQWVCLSLGTSATPVTSGNPGFTPSCSAEISDNPLPSNEWIGTLTGSIKLIPSS